VRLLSCLSFSCVCVLGKDAAERPTSYTRLSPPLTVLEIHVDCCSMSGHYVLGFDFFLLPICLSHKIQKLSRALFLACTKFLSLSSSFSLKIKFIYSVLVHVAT
jgi:hypothetical protein